MPEVELVAPEVDVVMPVINVAVSELTHTSATHSSTCGEETTRDNVNKGQTLLLLFMGSHCPKFSGIFPLENDLVPPTLQQNTTEKRTVQSRPPSSSKSNTILEIIEPNSNVRTCGHMYICTPNHTMEC